MEIDELSPLALAFMGDAVHTAFVREKVLGCQKSKMNTYHEQAKKFCNATCQAKVLQNLLPLLSEKESEIVRRAKNCKNKHTAKNCDEKTYKEATAFEALVGWLHLTQNTTRLNQILEFSITNQN